MSISPINVNIRDNSAANAFAAVIPCESYPEGAIREFLRKKPNQLMSICPEHNGVGKDRGLSAYAKGGLGCVSKEAPESFIQKEGMDVRTFLPYHAPNNPQGLMYVAEIEPEIVDGKPLWPKAIDPKKTVIKKVDPNSYILNENEKYIVMNSSLEQKGAYKGMARIMVLEDTGVKGLIKTMKESDLSLEDLPYHIFREANPPKCKDLIYFVHTPQVAAMKEAYGSEGAYLKGQKIGFWWDLYYSNCDKCIVDAMPQLAEKEGFNPANIWLHDRPEFPTELELIRRSADGDPFFSGLKIHSTLHNPGAAYQGYFDDKIGYFKIIFNPGDFVDLQASPDFQEIRRISKKPLSQLTPLEQERLRVLFDKYFINLVDSNGRPNISMIPVASRKLNPNLATVGAVSHNFGIEMKTLKDIAAGLTDAFSKIETLDITNGSAPASLDLDKIGNIGANGNGLSDHASEFTVYRPIFDEEHIVQNYYKPKIEPKPGEIDELMAQIQAAFKEKNSDKKHLQSLIDMLLDRVSIKEAKNRNKNWLLSIFKKCVNPNDEAATNKSLSELFFNLEQRTQKGMKVHGYILPTEDTVSSGGKVIKDRIFTSWGRSDSQKGFSVLVQSLYKFLSNPEIDSDLKIHAKLLFGSSGVWPKNSEEYGLIKKYIDLIRNLEGGKYKGNVCYVEGFYPNKLVACCDMGVFSSRYEPCGITPLETYAAGNPVISIKTGGAADFILPHKFGEAVGNSTGILSENPYMLDENIVDRLLKGKVSNGTMTLDEGRRELASEGFSKLFHDAMRHTDEEYHQMSANSASQMIEWHNNGAFNGGISANARYLEDGFGLRKIINPDGTITIVYKAQTRSLSPARRLTGIFGDTSKVGFDNFVDYIDNVRAEADTALRNNGQLSPSFMKRIFKDKRTYYAIAAITAAASIAAYALNRDKKEQSKEKICNIGNLKVYY